MASPTAPRQGAHCWILLLGVWIIAANAAPHPSGGPSASEDADYRLLREAIDKSWLESERSYWGREERDRQPVMVIDVSSESSAVRVSVTSAAGLYNRNGPSVYTFLTPEDPFWLKALVPEELRPHQVRIIRPGAIQSRRVCRTRVGAHSKAPLSFAGGCGRSVSIHSHCPPVGP